ncbi:2'-5' RNA ligase family protein [Acidisphaera sp. S103]|uniref:2'-5' RNA ligase family protein n=1 Tax=Acidisphaera sp. S103 TaxID=1747223 RepID=UPI00131C5C96|nr:2'-5' RNA ligase family protein [Acidisphaera sp. S103]
MPFAITLRLDPASADRIESLRHALATEGIDSDRYNLVYPAHITLAIYPDRTPEDRLHAALAHVTASWRILPVTLSGIGIFHGTSSILWAAPVVGRDLLMLHASLAEALPDLSIHPHYQPEAWTPHVTLTGALPDPGPALKTLLTHWQPVTGTLVQADLVRFRPVEMLQSRSLAQP